ncbi:hypothetical protein MO867_05890 [Microbulbifer sp. OS29]|uniref:Uncharacterized protein n=1 Tax=Microbulbifer okhotskensis TaxID=2926617 RepID=A0A9X2J3U4_9GAMM|nr:hypothetical protein [Microbulbifer okhotskensis]MCO1333867.1 hypothetical protein [Microbulbifer okhotskensis]
MDKKHNNNRDNLMMKGIPLSFSPIQLHNRLNRAVWIGFKRVEQDGRTLVFLCSGVDSGAKLSKNFETFAGQIVREFGFVPAEVEFIELREKAEQSDWYRWHAQWVGSAPMECRGDLVTSESSRRYLAQALESSMAAA